MIKKFLPISIQDFRSMRTGNFVYVDKTKHLYPIAEKQGAYFLSRPRRFGKSLLVSTLKELFSGQRDLFEGLWIHNNWNWQQTYPVLHISFTAINYQAHGLADGLSLYLLDLAKQYDIALTTKHFKDQFKELLYQLHTHQGQVVILIDEYDKPIIDYLEYGNLDTATTHRNTLKTFYSVLKDASPIIRFLFITGVSKFSKVSIFSDLNHLDDLTLHPDFSTLTGYTQPELELYFDDYIQAAQKKLKISRETLLDMMRLWYNGFSWDGDNKVYNPFGTLNFLNQKRFHNFWFSTGTPTFLLEQMKKSNRFAVENTTVTSDTLDKFDVDTVGIIALLFQTGYLTVKHIDPLSDEITLDYPNKEVRESIYRFMMSELVSHPQRFDMGTAIKDLVTSLNTGNLSDTKAIINTLLADLPYETYTHQSEGLYQGLLHFMFQLVGISLQSEVHMSRGRADTVVQTASHVYIFEFKFNKTAQQALDQIEQKSYAAKYKLSKKNIIGIGINFDEKTRQIDGWLEKML
jgi:hypothetical protein